MNQHFLHLHHLCSCRAQLAGEVASGKDLRADLASKDVARTGLQAELDKVMLCTKQTKGIIGSCFPAKIAS